MEHTAELGIPVSLPLYVMNVLPPNVYISNNKLTYVVHFPIVEEDDFRLFKAMSHFAVIETTDGFLFTDQLRDKYGKMTYIDLLKCHTVHTRYYISENNIPILSPAVSETDCSLALLHQSTHDTPKGCLYHYVQLKHTWFFVKQ